MTPSPLFKILWLEDEPDKNPNFTDQAYDEGLELSHVATIHEALAKLRNPHEFEGAIFDARGIKDKNDTADLQRIHFALTETVKLAPNLPLVIYTGQKGDSDDWKKIAENLSDEVQTFLKGSEEDQMFEHLKRLIEKQPEKLVRQKHREIYEFCDHHLGAESWPALLHCLLHIEHEQPMGGITPYNALRKIFEELCQAYGEKKLIPHHFYDDQVKMTDWVHFLAGNHRGYRFEPNFPSLPSLFTVGLLQIFSQLLNDGSHADRRQHENKQKAMIKQMSAATEKDHHLVHILTYLTIDLLRISKRILKEHSDPEKNTKLWERWIGTLKPVKDKWEIHLDYENQVVATHFYVNDTSQKMAKILKVRNKPLEGQRVYVELTDNTQKCDPSKYFASRIESVNQNI